ncbi:hypothetical protein CRE_27272 [Caenorhabditis remanei]|uniref:Uncharacterized protein n=1 Tax=Caenorhabditis remanei TaxID=31234 RepID=E3LPE1_CAERE|nr:hypothetical protein CRE_27272 [Caenorhabditis remanei]
MFLTLNMDGFRKRGLARGEFWPLYVAANDLNEERSKFSEYRPEVVMISSLIQTSKQIESGDFNAAFERMRCEVEETQRYPIEVTIDGVPHKIRLEIFQTVLDMDASRKIHGLPVWQSYNSCSRCSIKGQRIETKKGTKIVWLPEENDEQYSCLNIPTKLKTSCLPFPWKEGFDSLHLVNEGTSRDIFKDLLKGGEKYNVKIQSENNLKWVNCLSKAKNPKGVSSTILLNPIQLTTRTGSEVQQLFNVAVPMLVVVHNKCDIWLIFLYLQWITTRLVVDPNLSSKHCDVLLEIVPVLRYILKNHFPQFYSMKQHENIQQLLIVIYFCFQFVLDHKVPQLKYDGSPFLSSAAPFERLNQVLGRGTGAHTTRTLLNMCRRFIALQKAVSHCNVAIAKPDSPITFPKSMKSVDDEDLIHNTKLDGVPLTTHEKMYLRSHSIDITECRLRNSQVFTNNLETFRISTISNQKIYSTRRNCDDNVQHNCYIYFLDQQNSIQFGSIERIFTLDGRCVVLIHKFQLGDPFPFVRKYVEDMPELKRVFQLSERSNTYFKQIVGIDLVVIFLKISIMMRRTRYGAIGKQENPEKNKPKYTPKIPLAQISKNSTLEKPFRSTHVLKATPKREKNENGLKCETERSYPFSVQTEICHDRVCTEKRGNGQSFENSDRGHSIRNNSFQRETHGLRTPSQPVATGGLSSVQIEELAKSLERPKVPLFAALIANERADFEDTKSIIAAMLFIEGLPAPHEKPLSRLQCSVNSLSHTVKAAFQMSSLLVQILKKSTYPGFQIWKYTFYPKSSKSADVHFHKTPEHIVESLKDFCFDVTGCFLPDDFLGDPIDESHWFMEKLPFNDARTEIIRRRKMRQPVLETFTMALWQALRTLRNYHYDLSSRQLLNCTSRGDCTAHLKWEHLKNLALF